MLTNPEHVQADVLDVLGDPGDALDPLIPGRLVTGLRAVWSPTPRTLDSIGGSPRDCRSRPLS